MADILVRGLNSKAVKRLKDNARRNGRSLQSEAKLLLERAAMNDGREIAQIFDRWKARFGNRKFVNNLDLIREGRRR